MSTVGPARPAVLIMAKAPRPGLVKTRLHPLLGPDGCAALQAALIRNAGLVAAGAGDVTVFVAVDPPDAAGELAGLLPDGTVLLAQRGDSLGDRLAAATADVLTTGGRPVVVTGTDVPTLTPGLLTAALAELAAGCDAVFGPALDGGYYLAGLTRPLPGIFALDPALWGGERVLEASLEAARGLGLATALLAPLRDLDTPADARALLADPLLPAPVASVLRRHADPAVPGPLPVSIVLPVLNEAPGIAAALARLRRDFPGCELIVADGGSTDQTAELAAPLARVVVSAPGRARQMNAGAQQASGDVLWFIHADTHVHPAALGQIRAALADPATAGGGLRLRFDRTSPALRWISWTSNLRARHLRWIFGDQAMFIRRTVFDALGGFPDLPLMEDLEMSRRLRRHGRLVLLPAASVASARRFTQHGAWRMLAFMQYLKLLYFTGTDPARIAGLYRAGPPRRPPRSVPARGRMRRSPS